MESSITLRGFEAATAVSITGGEHSAPHAIVSLHAANRGWHCGRVNFVFRTFDAAQRVADAINEAVEMDRSPMREAAE